MITSFGGNFSAPRLPQIDPRSDGLVERKYTPTSSDDDLGHFDLVIKVSSIFPSMHVVSIHSSFSFWFLAYEKKWVLIAGRPGRAAALCWSCHAPTGSDQRWDVVYRVAKTHRIP